MPNTFPSSSWTCYNVFLRGGKETELEEKGILKSTRLLLSWEKTASWLHSADLLTIFLPTNNLKIFLIFLSLQKLVFRLAHFFFYWTIFTSRFINADRNIVLDMAGYCLVKFLSRMDGQRTFSLVFVVNLNSFRFSFLPETHGKGNKTHLDSRYSFLQQMSNFNCFFDIFSFPLLKMLVHLETRKVFSVLKNLWNDSNLQEF